MSRSRLGAPAAAILGLVALSFGTASAGTLVKSGFESCETWHSDSHVVSAPWPNAFNGGYALHVQDSQQFVKYPPSGSMSERSLSVRLHFRIESDALPPDPNHDDQPFDSITMLGVQPKKNGSNRPNVAIRRNDDMLVLRVEDYSSFEVLRNVVIVPKRWHVLEMALDQPTHHMLVALDGVEVFRNDRADIDLGQPFNLVELGIVYSQVNGHSLWFDDVLIRDKATLIGPELDTTATASPGVGPAPLAVSLHATSSDSHATIEWDFDGDGTFDATGATQSHTYSTIGSYPAVARVTSSSGARAAAYPPVVHALDVKAPAVTLVADVGGSSSLPFPRTYDFRAVATPGSGAHLKMVEWDWNGGDVFGWNARTPWDATTALTTFLPHRYWTDPSDPTVRVRVTDDSGRQGYAEMNLALPPGNDDPAPLPRDARAGIYETYGWKEIYVNRGNKLPAWLAGADVGAYFDWSAIETSRGVYDFGPTDGSNAFTYNGRIYQIVGSGKNVVLHHRAFFPSWVFNEVGKSSKKNPDGNNYPQFWDPRYFPLYREFIQASAANVQALLTRNPSWAGRFVVSRGQSFATDSELIFTGQVPVVAYPGTSSQMNLVASNFNAPPTGAYNVDFTPELASAYVAWLRATFAEAFAPLGIPSVFKPHSGGWYNGTDSVRADEEHRRALSNRGEGLFSTCAEPDTCEDHFFLGYTDRGLARGFDESNTPPTTDTVQYHYWMMLSELNLGIEYPSIYGDRAYLLEYQPDFSNEPVYAFVNRHVGFKSHPTQAASAWLALKPPTAPSGSNYSTGDYGALLRSDPHDTYTDASSVGSVHYVYTGPSSLGYPPTHDEPMTWARTCPALGALHFDLDLDFVKAHGCNWDVSITYDDSYQGFFTLTAADDSSAPTHVKVNTGGTNHWRTASVALRGVHFQDRRGIGHDFELQMDAHPTSFHLIVVMPRDDLPEQAPGTPTTGHR